MYPEINIREAHTDDLSILVENNLALAKETESLNLDKDVLRKGIEQALSRKECHYFVAVISGKVVGQTMITYEWSDWRNGRLWWIQSVYVKQEYRRRGVFSELYSYVIDCAKRTTKICGIRLYVECDNIVAQKTYAHLGMEESKYLMYEMDLMSGN